jgi:D-alanyl-D-alanine carboxypeptidase (penicillin-binding protein 5/6)
MIRALLSTAALAAALGAALPARADYETNATAAWLYDMTNDTLLLSKNADVPLPPASMSKLMTLYMLFEALRDGRVTLDTEFTVSARARGMGGSTMFLDETDRPTVEELIKGIIVQSGNDACVVVAEGLAGSEEAFARLMTERGRQIGLTNSIFVNSTGWPAPNHVMSMHDLGVLATHIIDEFPEYYPYFAITEWDFDGRSPSNRFNRNPVLRMGIGADGLKTGHTQEAGYGLVGSAIQGDRRIVFVVTGLDTDAERASESEQIINWAFRQYVEKSIADTGHQFAEAPVWMGSETRVGLVAQEPITVLVPAVQRETLQARIEYEGPIEAPIALGQHVADLVITAEGLPERRIPLVSDREVTRGGFVPRSRAAAQVLLAKALGGAQALTE